MSDLDSNQKAKLAEFSKKIKTSSVPQQQEGGGQKKGGVVGGENETSPLSSLPSSTEPHEFVKNTQEQGKKIETSSPDESTKPDESGAAVPPEKPIVDKAKEDESSTDPKQTTVEKNKTKKEDATSDDDEFFKWDADLKSDETTSSSVDLKKIGSALNLEVEVKDEEGFVKVISERLSRLKDLESQSSDSIPEPLKEVLDVAKKGGDWQTLVGSTLFDPSNLDPIDLFDREFERVEGHRYKKQDGSFDYEKLDADLDSIPEGVRVMQGNMIKAQLVAQHNQKKQAVIDQVKKREEVFGKQLSDAAKELPALIPSETFGINLEPKHVSYFHEGIASGKLVQKHLGNIDPSTLSKFDAKKLMKTLALAELGASISKVQYNKGIVTAKRSILDKTQNPKVIESGIPAAPERDEQRPVTPTEKLKSLFNKPANSL